VVLGLGMSFIWAPMTTAMLNSVDQEKSGIASAINGAIREIGTAFSIALLGTIATRKYQAEFANSGQIQELRQNTGDSYLQEMLDLIGSGASFGGNFIKSIPGTEALGGSLDIIVRESGKAFVSGMDRAFIIGSVSLIIASVISYFLISDNAVDIVEREPKSEPAPAPAD
jgi:hypothetical protein